MDPTHPLDPPDPPDTPHVAEAVGPSDALDPMGELAAFILARVEEDEVLLTGGDMMTVMAEERLLAECAAKRRLVAHVQSIDWNYEPAGDQNYMQKIFELLALPWIGHPAYNPHWAG